MDESSRKLESLIENQRDRIHRLEDLVRRWSHRDHSSLSQAGTLTGPEVKGVESEGLVDDASSTAMSESGDVIGPRRPIEQ
jgi:hypothetical protein